MSEECKKVVYKSQAELRKLLRSLLTKETAVVVDTNVESFQVKKCSAGDDSVVVDAIDRPSKLRFLGEMVVDKFCDSLREQRIDNIFLGVRNDDDVDDDDKHPLTEVYKYTKRPYDEIVPGLYLGSAEASKEIDFFDCIVNCTDNLKCWIPPKNSESKEKEGDREDYYLQTHWHDHPEQKILPLLPDLTHRIHQWLTTPGILEKPKKVLIHCEEGKSRSASLVIAYLLMCRGNEFPSLSSALDFVRSKRPIACPNKGFMAQLGNLRPCFALDHSPPPPLVD